MHARMIAVGSVQSPFSHVVPEVQAFASSHAAPGFAGMPPTHIPESQIPPTMHALGLSHGLPLGAGTATHESLCSLQSPTKHVSFGSAHVFGAPVQLPP